MPTESVYFNKPRYNTSQPNARKLTEAEAFQTQLQVRNNEVNVKKQKFEVDDVDIQVDISPRNQAPVDSVDFEDSDAEDFYDAPNIIDQEQVDSQVNVQTEISVNSQVGIQEEFAVDSQDSFHFEVSSPESPIAIGSSDSETGEEDQLESSPEEENCVPSTNTQPRRNIPKTQESAAAQRTSTAPLQTTSTRWASNVNRLRPQEAESSISTPKKRKLMIRKPTEKWTDEEKQALEAGLLHYKGPHWAEIKKKYANVLQSRTNVNLKDKARNEIKAMKRQGEEPQEGTPYYYINNPDLDVEVSIVEDNNDDEEEL